MRHPREAGGRRRVAQIAALALVWAIAVAALVSERAGGGGTATAPVKAAPVAGAGPSANAR